MKLVVEDQLLNKLDQVYKEVGNTPLIDLSLLSQNENVKIFAKKEWEQIGGSVKARAAFEIIKMAIKNGELNESIEFLDASSGNGNCLYKYLKTTQFATDNCIAAKCK